MSKYDFNIYTDEKDMRGYEAFIGPNGEFYRVKPMIGNGNNEKMSHHGWAEEFLEDFPIPSDVNDENYSLMGKLQTKLNVLIHVFGYIYYSHNHLLYGPIIIFPDKNYVGKSVTLEQFDVLFKVMILNNENPLENDFFLKALEGDSLVDVQNKTLI